MTSLGAILEHAADDAEIANLSDKEVESETEVCIFLIHWLASQDLFQGRGRHCSRSVKRRGSSSRKISELGEIAQTRFLKREVLRVATRFVASSAEWGVG